MTWLTWRQFRAQAAWVFGGVAVFAAVLAATGPRLAELHRTAGDQFFQLLSSSYDDLYLLGALLVRAVPAVIGVFWGAPLVARELETGTHRLVWNQSVTRTRWLAAKLGLVGLAAVAATGLLTLATSWWCVPIDQAIAHGGDAPGFPDRLSRMIFDSRGVVPVGWAALAFTLGVAVGIVLRRTVPAMAATLAGLAVAEGVMSILVRPMLIAPDKVTVPITADNLQGLRNGALSVDFDRHSAWVVAERTLDAAGQPVPLPPAFTNCMQSGGDPNVCGAVLGKLGYRQETTFHPAGHFWPLQWAETGLLLALALLIAALCLRWVRRQPA
ncbi:ABC transporter permease [Kitasatospora sp. RB6PN24]|uniref:ABC transporter permease n=1 Tax=Kitasatospora humi TaxID=2893891 RepID=UPI001E5E0A15|nr:ABC transporter permease [Kitasatospora humi]MCC9309055.1 ABC transporter permease [Kitasatospora humi]